MTRPRAFLGAALFGVLLSAATPTAATELEFLNSPALDALGLPFSEAVRVGDTLYLSGQLGNKPGTLELVEGGIEPETEQTLNNIKAALERHGSDLAHVAKCTVFLADIADWPAVNSVYTRFFAPKFPARSAMAGSGLALGAKVEIECIAVVK
jgi:2-iminobutanoate/2-iminopropanoate deaminase